MANYAIKGLIHSGITVKDLNRSLKFYEEMLGLKKIQQQTNDTDYVYKIVEVPGLEKMEVAFLQMPDGNVIELLEYVGLERYSGAARTCDYGTGHICLHVTHLDEMYKDLKRKGVQFISKEVVTITAGHNKGSKAVYMKDPDGYVIELMERIN